MPEKLVVTQNLWKYGDLSVLRVGDIVRFRKANGCSIEVKQSLIADSLLPRIKSAEEWYAVGRVYFGSNSFRLDEENDMFAFVVYYVGSEKTEMPADTAKSLLEFLQAA